MKGLFKKAGAVAMAAALMAGPVGTLTSCKEEDPDTFTIWIGSIVNSSIYDNYGKNPVMQYLENKFDIKLEFMQPPAPGKEAEDFNKLTGSGEYPDMMDLSYYTGVVADLYDEGYGPALDLTDYIADYMPNYSKFLSDNAELTKYAKIDGKYITINNYNAGIPNQWGGFMYRRDWLVKYDGNPDQPDGDGNYKDGVKFPDGYLDEDGYDNPLTIADWEYMFSVFEKAEGYKYAITLPNIGYHETGEIVSAFGVGGLWNLYEGKEEGVYDVAKFGATTDEFRKYTETMNKWYEEGWLDPNFTSNSGDLFYALDSDSFMNGTVGMFYGTAGQVGDLILSGQEATGALEGIDLWGARQPKETADSPDPTVFYLDGQETSRRWIVTQAIEGKNVEKFFNMLDWLYSEEGSIVKFYGLSTEQWNEYDIDRSLVSKFGLEDGCYWWVDPATGEEVAAGTEGAVICQNLKILNGTGDIPPATNGQYFFGLGFDEYAGLTYLQNSERKAHAYREWSAYTNYGAVQSSLLSQMTSDEGGEYNTTQTKIRDQIGKQLPNLIKGGVTDANWNSFLGQLRTRKCDENTEILQAVIDRVSGKN